MAWGIMPNFPIALYLLRGIYRILSYRIPHGLVALLNRGRCCLDMCGRQNNSNGDTFYRQRGILLTVLLAFYPSCGKFVCGELIIPQGGFLLTR